MSYKASLLGLFSFNNQMNYSLNAVRIVSINIHRYTYVYLTLTDHRFITVDHWIQTIRFQIFIGLMNSLYCLAHYSRKILCG